MASLKTDGRDACSAASGSTVALQLAETVELEDLIGVDGCPKLFLRITVALVYVWMVHLEPVLVAASYLLRCCIVRQTERFESLGFQDLEFATLAVPDRTADGSGISDAWLILVPKVGRLPFAASL